MMAHSSSKLAACIRQAYRDRRQRLGPGSRKYGKGLLVEGICSANPEEQGGVGGQRQSVGWLEDVGPLL